MDFGASKNGKTTSGNRLLINLSSKAELFIDQTPTPTRLIKNCEEVGLFDDLGHVNPFEETFRLACQHNVQQNSIRQVFNAFTDENSLHTPQVFPQFDASVENEIEETGDLNSKETLDSSVLLDGEHPQKYFLNESEFTTDKFVGIRPKPAPQILKLCNCKTSAVTDLQSNVHQVQSSLCTMTFPTESSSITTHKSLILPKLTTKNHINAAFFSNANTSLTLPNGTTSFDLPNKHSEPSSASMTPTSQLPIKERLKAILNQSNKTHSMEWPHRNFCNLKTSNTKISALNDIMERRRAASSRYRHKIRSEYNGLKKSNAELLQENEKLKTKIAKLEKELLKLRSPAYTSHGNLLQTNQLQIPASAVHLVMSIPNIIVPFFSDTKSQYYIE